MVSREKTLRTHAWPAVPTLLAALGTDPSSSQLLETLNKTTLAQYSPKASALWLMRGEIPMLWDELHDHTGSLPWHGHMSGFVSDEFDAIVHEAVFTGLIVSNEYQASSTEPDQPGCQVCGVAVPIVACGLVVGVFGFASKQSISLRAEDIATLSACANAISLWVYQHPAVSKWVAENSELRDINARSGVRALPVNDTQRKILTLLYQGHSERIIAAELNLSLGRIQREVQRACVALDVKTKTAAIARAKAHGLIHG